MTAEQNVALARRAAELFNERDFAGMRDLYHPEFVFRPAMGMLEEREYRGPDAMRDYYGDIGASFQELSLEIESLRPIGSDTVLAVGRLHGSGASSGAQVSGERGVVARFREGKVLSMVSFASVEDALRVAEERET